MRDSRRFLVVFGAAALLLGAPAHGTQSSERGKQKRAAESERVELQQKLSTLKRDITRTESARSHVADELAHSEKAISDADRALHELGQEQRRTEAKLNQLSEQQNRLAAQVAAQQKQLAQLLRDQYVAGNEDRIRLLLSGDNPNRINRELQYMGYVSQAQAKLIDTLKGNLQAIETTKADAQVARDELEEIGQEQREQKALLEKEKTRRAALLAQLSGKLAAQRKEAGNVERDERRLASLVDKLARLIEEQQKAEAAAALKRRQQEQAAREARAKAQRESKIARAAPGKDKPVNPDAIDNDEPPAPKSPAGNELITTERVQVDGLTRPFSALRGQLRLPVRGELAARYGSRRADGPSWKGLFIRAAEGAEVKAVAAGRVVFSEWLRGFGNLVIIDHGSEYMTIYGNNQSVLKHAGDVVKTGDVIASAGNSGGNEQSGLYFEMRHQGRAFDPLGWISIR
jgi:septal ring factor EnvC (AmiA/AmiB activator)